MAQGRSWNQGSEMTDWKRIKPVDDSECVMRPTVKGWTIKRDDARYQSLVELFGTPLNYAKEVVFSPNAADDIFEALELMENERNDRRNGNDRVDRI